MMGTGFAFLLLLAIAILLFDGIFAVLVAWILAALVVAYVLFIVLIPLAVVLIPLIVFGGIIALFIRGRK